MNKEFEKILKKTKEKCKQSYITNHGKDYTEFDICTELSLCFNEVQRIVQEVVEEYNNGWIPCSEKLPDVRQDVLVTVKYTGFMEMHGYWIKTGHMEAENDWWGDCAGGEVIAWMELPSVYRPKEK